ncbi:MAG: (2Fe-2S)-binding protein, partial [Oscillospiraceae bacterium]|nr:(2Fe-2S)-binding protein [Oscillospiraceae bacterium]
MTTDNTDVLICRCQEITREDIRRAVEDGATTVDGVKRRTRACMG